MANHTQSTIDWYVNWLAYGNQTMQLCPLCLKNYRESRRSPLSSPVSSNSYFGYVDRKTVLPYYGSHGNNNSDRKQNPSSNRRVLSRSER